MDEPFHKRPRLAMFAHQSSDAELDQDLDALRYRNDRLLKSRFESIFEKYSHDFSGVGDEIDLDTGNIVVNNGHLEGMENETDTGTTTSTREDSKGARLLRAMTEAQDAEDEYFNEGADDVMMSVEEIAENAAMAEDDDPIDSDEELFTPVQQPPPHSQVPFFTPPDSRGSQNTVKSGASDSDDSLFEVRYEDQRSASPESLFEARAPTHLLADSVQAETTGSFLDSSALGGDADDNAILEKFGPQLGPEVLEIIHKARNAAAEAPIEPAWRIPANVIPPKPSRSLSKSETPSLQVWLAPEFQQASSPEHAKSLWEPARPRKTKRATHRARVMRCIRAESEDPLQEDFQDQQGRQEAKFDSGDESEWKEEEAEEKKSTKKFADDEQVILMRKGTCFYCSGKWASRAGVFKHWTRLAKDFENLKADPNDVHDLEYIHSYYSNSNTGTRGARLVISDFKAMVELHEGAGLSFHEIAACRALRTRKTGPALNDVYDRYRNPPDYVKAEDAREWSGDELIKLDQLCQNPIRDVSTFSPQFQGRSNTEVGDKLAEIWLKSLRDSGQLAARQSRQIENLDLEQAPRLDTTAYHPGSSNNAWFIKVEESDDELFRR